MNRRGTHRALIFIAIVAGLLLSFNTLQSQGRFGDVMVTVVKEKVIALPAGGSAVEEALNSGETIVTTEAKGQTGFAQTSIRLLAFSSELRRWAEVSLAAEERVERHRVLPRLIVVQTNRQLYGFQEGRAHWKTDPLGTNEKVKQVHGRGHVAVAITSDRALAFSSFTGGFFSIPWSSDEKVASVDEANDTVLIRTFSRTLAFRSQTTDWIEVK